MSDRAGISRRALLTGAFRGRNAALAATGALAWSHVVTKSKGAEAQLRPPGARDEPDFLAACIKCGQCVEACPFETLKLATTADDEAPGIPYFEPRETACEMCEDVPCVKACPTDALLPETAIEEARMGLAVLLDQENCVAFQGLRCEVCYRACPLMGKSIKLEFRPQERTGKHAYFLPVVDSDYCTGCGKCENACILEEPAIRVLPHELAQGKQGEHYRLGWKEEARVSRDFTAPERAPDMPGWQDNTERVLESMDDLPEFDEP